MILFYHIYIYIYIKTIQATYSAADDDLNSYLSISVRVSRVAKSTRRRTGPANEIKNRREMTTYGNRRPAAAVKLVRNILNELIISVVIVRYCVSLI